MNPKEQALDSLRKSIYDNEILDVVESHEYVALQLGATKVETNDAMRQGTTELFNRLRLNNT